MKTTQQSSQACFDINLLYSTSLLRAMSELPLLRCFETTTNIVIMINATMRDRAAITSTDELIKLAFVTTDLLFCGTADVTLAGLDVVLLVSLKMAFLCTNL